MPSVADEEAIIKQCRNDFFSFFLAFGKEFHGDKFVHGQWNKEYCDALQYEGLYYALKEEMPIMTLEAPIQMGKSYALVMFACWVLGNWQRYRRRINYYTAGKNTARDFAINMESITKSKTFIKCFGKVRNTASGEYFLGDARLDMRLAGGGNVGYSSHMTLIDDPYSSYLDALSPAIREQKWNSCMGNLMTRRQSISLVVVMHSRWFSDDMIGRIKEKAANGEYKGNRVISHCWPAINSDGEALFPEFRSLNFLEAQKSLIGDLLFAANYLQKPIDLEKSIININKFMRYGPDDAHEHPDMSYITVDSAFSTKDTSDRSVLVWNTVQDGVLQVRDVRYGRWDFETLRDNVRNFALETACSTIWIENKASGQSLLQVLQNEIERGQLHNVCVEPLYPTAKKDLVTGDEQTADKLTRWLEVSPALDHKCVYLPIEAPWLEDYMKECMAFDGKGNYHDDFVDAGVLYNTKLAMPFLEYDKDPNYKTDEKTDVYDDDFEDLYNFTPLRDLNDGGFSL